MISQDVSSVSGELNLTTVVLSVSSAIFGIILVFWTFSLCFLAAFSVTKFECPRSEGQVIAPYTVKVPHGWVLQVKECHIHHPIFFEFMFHLGSLRAYSYGLNNGQAMIFWT